VRSLLYFHPFMMSMKAVVLAGGFAKRMWPLTKDFPKQLLDVAGKPTLWHVIENVFTVDDISEVLISINTTFEGHFRKFIDEWYLDRPVRLVVEAARSETEKLGSIGALGQLIRDERIKGELMVVGGDNLFEFKLSQLVELGRNMEGSAIACYDVGSLELSKKYGIVELGEDGQIVNFLEKPSLPPSTLAATACYYLDPEGVKNILKYLDEGNNPDALGYFIQWSHKKVKMYALRVEGAWFDIGSLEILEAARDYYNKRGI